MKITLDNTCLISLKNKDGEYAEIKTILGLHPNLITIFIPAISASENQKGGILHTNFAQFEDFLIEIGCEAYELLNPMTYLDISFLDHTVLADADMKILEYKIHNILFPNIPFKYSEHCSYFNINPDNNKLDKTWRRAKCDVQALWCHIYYKNDIFVTQDNNYHKSSKKPQLIALGAGDILRPCEYLAELKK